MTCCTTVVPTINIGYAFGWPLTIVDDYDDPIDLTAWTLTSKLKSVDADGEPVALIATFTVEEIDYTLGQIKITLSSVTTASLAAGRYWADVAMEHASLDDTVTPKFECVVNDPMTDP